jgi:hypothetical protein
MNLCDVTDVQEAAARVVRLHSLVHVSFVVSVGEAVVQPLQHKWVTVMRGSMSGDVVWLQLVGKTEGSEFDIPLPASGLKRLKLDLGSSGTRAASVPPRVRGGVLQVVQPQFAHVADAMEKNLRQECVQAETLYCQGSFVQARALCERICLGILAMHDEELSREERARLNLLVRAVRSLQSCCAAQLGWSDEAVFMAVTSATPQPQLALFSFRAAVMRFATQPDNLGAVREALMRIPSHELVDERRALEQCMRRYSEQRPVDVDNFRPAEEEVVHTTVLPPSPPQGARPEDVDLATAKTEDDDDDQENQHNKRTRTTASEPSPLHHMYI